MSTTCFSKWLQAAKSGDKSRQLGPLQAAELYHKMQDRVDFEKDWNLFEIDTAEKLMNHLASQKPRDDNQISIMVERAVQFFKKFNPEKVIETNFGSAFN